MNLSTPDGPKLPLSARPAARQSGRADGAARAAARPRGNPQGAPGPKAKNKQVAARTGPKPGRPPRLTRSQIWRNRLLALIILALAIAGLIFLLTTGIGKAQSWLKAQAQAAAALGVPAEHSFPPPSACGPGVVTGQAHPLTAELPAGITSQIEVTLRNTSKEACFLEGGPSQLGVRVVSGNEIVWTSTDCADVKSSRRLLLDAGQEWTTKISWDGQKRGPSCEVGGGPATAGTYRALAILAGEISGSEAVFRIL